MPLSAGTKLGAYEIVAAIGAGGMGEVYRARDPKLGRDVAVKVLPEAFAGDAARMARFQREAKVLASLDHPNIASIYGLEESGGPRALIMQLVEGPTLADRIRQGSIPVDEAVRLARQIADALEYAHERGIVHRDLKPANVKVTVDDTVKVLDFSLAKALESDAASANLTDSPTISQMATQQGMLLGTAAYMSPEQAKGKPVDRRADIWAFGCVLYEMLTGKRAFRGETATDTLAAVIKEEPDWSRLPVTTPIRVRVLLLRCLQKEPRQRLRDIGDARISLDEAIAGAPEDAPSLAQLGRPTRRAWVWVLSGVAAALLAATTLLAFLYFHERPPAAEPVRFEIALPPEFTGGGAFALSPDGRKLAFIAAGEDGQNRLWVRTLDTLELRPLEGTEGASMYPVWSPDSRFIAFWAQGKVSKIEASGGPPVAVCDTPMFVVGAWTRDDKILFGTMSGLMRVAASGGAPSVIAEGISVSPAPLPDGHHFVYLREDGDSGIYIGSLDAKPREQTSRKLLPEFSRVSYAYSSDRAVGYLLFVRGAAPGIGTLGTLMAQPFDARRLALTGEAFPIAEHVSNNGFSASATDRLVYMAKGGPGAMGAGGVGNIRGQLTWFDREGKVLGTIGELGIYRSLALSPDGGRVAFERTNPKNLANHNLWLYDFARGVTTRFTFDSSWDSNPVWSPDGSHIAFSSNRSGNFDLYQKASNLAGEDELLFKSSDYAFPSSWSSDGRFLLYYTIKQNQPGHVSLLPLHVSAADRKPIPLDSGEQDQVLGRLSPDGRWIAYHSDESGKNEIYVRPLDPASVSASSAGSASRSGKWMVSKGGGITPLWRHDGKELFYLSLDGTAMAVEVNTSTRGAFQPGVAKDLFKVARGLEFWEVSADGKRFLMPASSALSATVQPPFTVVLNWPSLLKK